MLIDPELSGAKGRFVRVNVCVRTKLPLSSQYDGMAQESAFKERQFIAAGGDPMKYLEAHRLDKTQQNEQFGAVNLLTCLGKRRTNKTEADYHAFEQ